MQRVKRSTAVAALPAMPAGGTPGFFANPNPGGGVPATIPGYEWFNSVQEELCALVTAAGLPLDINDSAQLLTALVKKGMQGAYFNAVSAGGTADAITGALFPAITALTHGMTLYIRAGLANATTTPTFKADGTTAKTIVKGAGAALAVGDIAGAGHWLKLQYDATLDKWVLLNPATGVATVTAPNDASYVDNSVKPASTSWVRGAMSAIATAAGFASSFSSNGYVKFPGWLGSFLIQWGSVTTSAGSASVTWPLAFTTAAYQMATSLYSSLPVTGTVGTTSLTTSGCSIATSNSQNGAAIAATVGFVVVGK